MIQENVSIIEHGTKLHQPTNREWHMQAEISVWAGIEHTYKQSKCNQIQ